MNNNLNLYSIYWRDGRYQTIPIIEERLVLSLEAAEIPWDKAEAGIMYYHAGTERKFEWNNNEWALRWELIDNDAIHKQLMYQHLQLLNTGKDISALRYFIKTLAYEVQEMRTQQKLYFKTKDQQALMRSIGLENKIDKTIIAVIKKLENHGKKIS